MLPKLIENSKLIKLKKEINGMLYAFFWVIPRRLNFTCQCFGTLHRLCRHTTYEDGKTECSETLAHKIRTQGNHSKEIIQL